MATFAVTPGFGEGGTVFSPEQLTVLGAIVGDEAKIELTTFKQLYVTVAEERVEEIQARLKDNGLEIHPAGFFTKSLITCNFCRGADEAGLEVAKRLDQAIVGHATPNPLKIGYAGCGLGTSEPLLKDIAVVKMRDRFDIYLGGDPKGLKPTLAQPFLTGVAADQLVPIVTGLIACYQRHGNRKEKFSKFVERMTMEALRETVA